MNSEGDQPWDFFERNDAKPETPVLWPPHAKSWLIGKDSDAWRDWEQEEKGTTEDEMTGWHHWLNGRESEWTPEDGDGQGGLACCDSWGCKELDTTERLNWTELMFPLYALFLFFFFLCPKFSYLGFSLPLLSLFLYNTWPHGFTCHLYVVTYMEYCFFQNPMKSCFPLKNYQEVQM